MSTKSKNFLATSYSDAIATINAYEKHRCEGHPNSPPGFKCPSDVLVDKLLESEWPTDEPEDYFRGLFDMCVAANLMWTEAQKHNPLLNVLCKDVDHNLMAMMAVTAMKWKEARERLGVEEVKEFSEMEEIDVE